MACGCKRRQFHDTSKDSVKPQPKKEEPKQEKVEEKK